MSVAEIYNTVMTSVRKEKDMWLLMTEQGLENDKTNYFMEGFPLDWRREKTAIAANHLMDYLDEKKKRNEVPYYKAELVLNNYKKYLDNNGGIRDRENRRYVLI